MKPKLSFFGVWVLSGAATVVFPLFFFTVARLSNNEQRDEGGSGDQNGNYYYPNGVNPCPWWKYHCYEYDERMANEQQENNNNNYQNNAYQNGNNNNYYGNNCPWYHWHCSYPDEGSRDDAASVPWWWFGGAERDRHEEERASPGMVLAYLWSLLLFAGVLHFGYKLIRDKRETLVMLALFFLANFSIILMILLQGMEGAVEVEGRQMEANGFCGQVGVLLFLTYFFWLIFSVAFMWTLRNRKASSDNTTVVELEDPYDYRRSFPDLDEDPSIGSGGTPNWSDFFQQFTNADRPKSSSQSEKLNA